MAEFELDTHPGRRLHLLLFVDVKNSRCVNHCCDLYSWRRHELFYSVGLCKCSDTSPLGFFFCSWGWWDDGKGCRGLVQAMQAGTLVPELAFFNASLVSNVTVLYCCTSSATMQVLLSGTVLIFLSSACIPFFFAICRSVSSQGLFVCWAHFVLEGNFCCYFSAASAPPPPPLMGARFQTHFQCWQQLIRQSYHRPGEAL